jgi:F-type H+-transporting ATPase subunit epsilon
MSFRCVVVTPEQQTLDETVTQAVLPAHDGLIGILTDRSPLLVKLAPGPLRVDIAGAPSRTYFIDGGIAQMKSNNLAILTNEATLPQDINADTARAEFAEAQARKSTDQKSAEERDRQLARARATQALAGKKG